jgi:tRNA G37 N-methylase TrmD
VDAIVRLIPDVLGDDAGAMDESFATGLIESSSLYAPARVSRLENPRYPDQRQPRPHRTRQRRLNLLPPGKS